MEIVRGGPAKRSQCLSYGAEGLEGLEYHLNHETKKTGTQCGIQGACCIGSHQGYQDDLSPVTSKCTTCDHFKVHHFGWGFV
jgi:hypothetical protein